MIDQEQGTQERVEKLNTQGYRYLKNRRGFQRFKNKFALVFVSDSHVGQVCPPDKSSDSLVRYSNLLRHIKNNSHDVLAIIHGGDGTHRGRQNLQLMVNRTRQILYHNLKPGEEHLPFFMNLGNHDYTRVHPAGGPATYNRKDYHDLIGKANQMIQLLPQRARIVLLETGWGIDGRLETASSFSNQLAKLAQYMNSPQNKNAYIIIDMHIPPRTGGPIGNTTHSLNPVSSQAFRHFLDVHGNRVTAVITHHRHCYYQAKPEYYTTKQGRKIPIYLTAFGGQCDNKHSCPLHQVKNPYYEFIKLHFGWQGGRLVVTGYNRYPYHH